MFYIRCKYSQGCNQHKKFNIKPMLIDNRLFVSLQEIAKLKINKTQKKFQKKTHPKIEGVFLLKALNLNF